MPGGRPTKYKKQFAEQAFELSLLGLTDLEMANVFGVQEKTLNNWKLAHPEFLQALKDGKDEADAKVAKSLYQTALEGNTTAQIFWLKNRKPKVFRDKQEIAIEGGREIYDLKPLKPEGKE